ncbi:MAG: hypothetical protein U0Q19_13815 [Kineosporiaceae bacterium]
MIDVHTTVRLHLLTWKPAVAWPWGILAASFVINLLVQLTLSPAARAQTWTGGLASIYAVVAVWATALVSQVFPFALGLGITRRDYALGTALTLLTLAVVFALALTGLRAVEDATDGFGVGMAFFAPAGLAQDGLILQTLVYATGFVLVGSVMSALAVVHHRWRVTGLFTLIIALILAGGAAGVLVTWRHAWGPVLDAVTGLPTVVAVVVLPLSVAVLAAGAGFAGLRRATV